MNRIVATLSRLLEPADREYACGDLEELRLSAPAAAASILWLWTRRQLAEWSHWEPWAALFGVTGVAGLFLSGLFARVETGIFLQIRTYLHYGVAYEPGGVSVAQEITYTATAILALLLWSWACGFVLASLSRRTFWITSFLFYCVVRDGWILRLDVAEHIILKHGLWVTMLLQLLPLDAVMIAFLFALAGGACSARQGILQLNTRLCLLAVGLILPVLLVWMESWFAQGFAHWSEQSYHPAPFVYRVLPWLGGVWPVFLIPILQNARQQPGRLSR